MASIQERLQIKREPLDKWSTREQLCLASAVARSGDQNWMSVSRALKPFGDPNRPADWFHQKNCAAQYGALLENVETPKRKKRTSSSETVMETPTESILRKLTTERRMELKKLLAEEKAEYVKLQEEMKLLQSGSTTEEQLDQWCKEIDEEEKLKEQEATAHTQWLRERELRKQEIERVWRPVHKITTTIVSQKRKASESIDSAASSDTADDMQPPQQEQPAKPPVSPLLTSLLKSPSHAQNIVTSSILHSAITSQRNSSTNPTIASLLNSSANVTVSPSLQQLVSTAIGQEPVNNAPSSINEATPTSTLDDAPDPLPNLKVEDIENTILSSDDPLPEIKNEEVEVIISDLIENPEQHLQLDDNDDIISNLESELDDLVNEENAAKEEEERRVKAEQERLEQEKLERTEENKIEIEQTETEPQKEVRESPTIDPFEFQEDPEVFHRSKLTPIIEKLQTPKDNCEFKERKKSEDIQPLIDENDIKKEIQDEPKKEILPGSVEIVEVLVLDDEDISKELNKSEIQDIVHSNKVAINVQEHVKDAIIATTIKEKSEDDVCNDELKTEKDSIVEESADSLDLEIKSGDDNKEADGNYEAENSRRPTFTPEYTEDIFEDMRVEVTKLDKTGKAKRDYSRTKKKEEKENFDILLAVEKAVSSQLDEELNEVLSEKEDDANDKKLDMKAIIKIEIDRSNSPWTEEEELSSLRTRRRYSTPATPTDSIPNSPASSITCEDERDYRNWKKSVMLVYSRLATHKYASLFLKPITDDQAPGYHTVIYRPMDLQTIRKNIENGAIRSTLEFQRDVLLMFHNAIMYNKTNQHVFNMTQEMQQESIESIQTFLQAQQDLPARRETRTSEPGSKRKRGPEDNVRNKKKKED